MSVYLAFWFTSLASALLIRRRLATFFFMASVFLFLGFRYETGFDWPVYKEIYNFFLVEFSIDRALAIQLVHVQEIGFLLLLGAMSQVFPAYEYPQAIFSLVFLYSFFKLSTAYPNSRPALALALYFAFFLLAVGFSTVRQTLAMSLFNLGIYYFVQNKPVRQYFFFGAAVSIQVSTGMLVGAFLIARILMLRNRVPGVVAFLMLCLITFLLIPIIFQIAMQISPNVAERLQWSIERASITSIGYFNLLLLLYGIGIGVMASSNLLTHSGSDPETVLFRSLIVVLSATMVAFTYFPVIRDRVAYELVLLFCILISNKRVRLRYPAMLGTLAVGLLYQLLILGGIADLAFAPYQNSIIMAITGAESTGAERSATYMSLFNEIFR